MGVFSIEDYQGCRKFVSHASDLGSLFPFHIPHQDKFSLFTTVFLFLFLRLQTSGFHTSNRAWRNNSVAMLTISFDEASFNLD